MTSNNGSNFEKSDLISQWRCRRREILDMLSPEIRKEYYQLGAAIKSASNKSNIGDEEFSISMSLKDGPPLKWAIWYGPPPPWWNDACAWCFTNGVSAWHLTDHQCAAKPGWYHHIAKAGGPPCAIFMNAENNAVGWCKPADFNEFKAQMAPLLRPGKIIGGLSIRVPMSLHKQNLIAFLERVQSATRPEIIAQTGIPEGSLSQLLREEEFESVERGRWKLKQK